MSEDEKREEQLKFQEHIQGLEQSMRCLRLRRTRYLHAMDHVHEYIDQYLSEDALRAEANVNPDVRNYPSADEVAELFKEMRTVSRRLTQAREQF